MQPLPAAEPTTEPDIATADPGALLRGYLDYYRAVVLRKLDGLDEQRYTSSLLPSGWTPLGLLVHLTCMERRWFVWGFAAEPVDDPWADHGPDGGWRVPPGHGPAQVQREFRTQCARSRDLVDGVPLTQRAAVGGRFPTPADAPTLGWIMMHVLQEYARHAGHLDVVRELIDGGTGE